MPDDLLGHIARLISDGLNDGLLAEEVADVLWMARFLRPPDSAQAPPPASADPVAREPARHAGPELSASSAHGSPVVPAHDVEFHPLPSRHTAVTAAGRPAASVRVPGVTALPHALEISRALRPLKRRAPRTHIVVLDEEATAAAFGDTGLILPVWQPGTERWLQVDLVVDTSASMVIWQQTAAQLLGLLEHHGAFRNVRAWAVDSDQPDPRLVPFSRRPSALPAITHSLTELIDPTGRRAVLVLTDAVGKGWHGGEMMTHLLPWAGSCPLAIIQVLPRRLWHRTALDTVAVTARMRPGSRRPFHVVRVDDWAPVSGRAAGWVPVLYPSAEWLRPWAVMVGGMGEQHAQMFATPLFSVQAAASLPDGGGVPASERLWRFSDHEASPEALELAGYLAAAPLVLPVMRLVQQAMMPESAPEHLAEVFLSGLLARASPAVPGEDPDMVMYEFRDGVREQLLGGLTQRESLGVLEVLSGVSGAVAKRFGGTLDFRALAVAAGTDALPEESLPFARIAASVLRGLGGIYGDLAAYLTAEPASRPPAAATTTSQAAHSPGLPDTHGSAMSTEQQIPAVLAARAAQRDFVDRLAVSWESLAASCAALTTSAADLAVTAAGITAPDVGHADVFADVAGYLAESADWRARAASVSAAMTQAAASVRALQRRIHRETINIAVMGTTGAGKSTLLRKLTGLSGDVIPSNRFSSTTATPIRISHEPRSGAGHAVLTLHTWETFRAEVLVPLHERARIPGNPPSTVDEFRRFPGYQGDLSRVPADHAGTEHYRLRLRIAQDSLPSYESLLRRGTLQISLEDLRPFAAYPAEEDSGDRPYHAVRSIDIFCVYPAVGAVPLVLIDLPGTAEAGLDIHQRFLTELRNDADLLLIVKRPSKAPATDADWNAMQLADDASAGVRRGDFVHYVINRDADVPSEYFDSALARATADARNLGIDVRVCDIERSAPDEVTQAILAPELSLLTERLASMDRDAAMFVLAEITGIVTQARNLADELVRRIGSWQASLPDLAARLRGKVRELKILIASDLTRVCEEYDQLSAADEPISELDDEIGRADSKIREWLAAGLGTGSDQQWLDTLTHAIASRSLGEELDSQYHGAGRVIAAAFSRIDAAFERSADRLWGTVAGVLRARLTGALVPADTDSRSDLAAFAARARQCNARNMAEATDWLLSLPANYGSIFFRAGLPVLRTLTWYEPGASGGLAGDPVGPDQRAPYWLDKLRADVERTAAELQKELRSEAQRAPRILAAAIYRYSDMTIAVPGTEIEFERLTLTAQQEIWPGDYDRPSEKVVADLAALGQRGYEASAAADQIASLTEAARRL